MNLEAQLRRLASLSEPTRWAIYRYVTGQRREVGREEVAEALEISRALAAFHLDRLAEEGMLETGFRRLTGNAGPGAGRPAKVYRRSASRVEIALPPTRYELIARLLVRAIVEAGADSAMRVLSTLAAEQGAELGAEARRRAGSRAGRALLLAKAVEVLVECGFEPTIEPSGEIHLRNCPFDAAARENRQIVCGMNLALMDGLLRGLRLKGASARLDPKPGFCCVVIGAGSRGPGRRSEAGG